jgi:hypothetical protein
MAAKSKTRKNKLLKKRLLFESSSDELSSDELPLESKSEVEIEGNENDICLYCEEFGQDKVVWVCCMSCKKWAHFVYTVLENVKKRYTCISHFANRNIFFTDCLTRRVVANVDQACFCGLIFFMNIIFVLIKNFLKCIILSIYCGLMNSIFFNPLFLSCTPK